MSDPLTDLHTDLLPDYQLTETAPQEQVIPYGDPVGQGAAGWNPAPTPTPQHEYERMMAAQRAAQHGLGQAQAYRGEGIILPSILPSINRCNRRMNQHYWECKHEAICECGEATRTPPAMWDVKAGL